MKPDLLTTYLDESTLPYSFCPGCGHSSVVEALNAALVRQQIDPHKLAIVTDIGCAGLADKYFTANAFHGLHGRAVTYATGIKLANPELKVVALVGDGGCGIGGHHLISAARRNIGVTTLVFNNFNYGMTGGQHSATTPLRAETATTQFGNLERPMDLCATAAVNGASFVARSTVFEAGLADLVEQALQNEGFSLVDIWELCAAYFAPRNRFNRKRLEETLAGLGLQTGVLHQEQREEYSRLYRQAAGSLAGQPVLPVRPLEQKYPHALASRQGCVIAGAAGQKIGAAAGAFSRGAALAGLWATQRNDYPVTVRTGYSLSEVIFSPQEVRFTGIVKPDWMLVLFPEGLKVVRGRLAQLTEADTLYINASLLAAQTWSVQTRARVVALDFTGRGKPKHWCLMALAEILRHSGIYPLEALNDAVRMQPEYAEENLAAIEAGQGLIE